MNDAGHEAVGQALLISAAAIAALSAVGLGGSLLSYFDSLIAALS